MRRLLLLVTMPFLLDAAVAWALAGPAPAAGPARSTAVFFDWDAASLSPHGRTMVAAAGRNSSGARIDIGSQPDIRAGISYRRVLTSLRAHEVVAELLRDGVPGERIAVQGGSVTVAGRVDLAMR